MAFDVLLDTCVIYPANLRDTLLLLAEADLYRPRWSADIMVELDRNLVEHGVDPASVARLTTAMNEAFLEANVTGYERLIESLTCDVKDRHVLAAALRCEADALVTFNLSDFPARSTESYDVEVLHPDEFLLDLLDLAPRTVMSTLQRQADSNRREPRTLQALLDALAKAGVPRFVAEVRRHQ